MISINSLLKVYASRQVLSIDSLSIEEGKKYALIGANGSGKTTFLRILAKTLEKTSGSIDYGSCKRIGYMPQKPYSFAFSALKNVMLGLEGEISNEQKKILSLDALKELGLLDLAQARCNKMSGGEMQKIALARLILSKKELLILDEPTSATDIAGNDLVEAALNRYHKKTGCTIIFSTHSPTQALRLADNIILMDSGKIAEVGSAEQVLKAPISECGKIFLSHWRL